MQVRDQNMLYALKTDSKTPDLHLRSFTTIDKNMAFVTIYVLGSRISP